MYTFPSLTEFEPTRQTLQLYSNAVSVIARAHGIPHPQWWHISLKVRADGLATDNIPLPGGGILNLIMDLQAHEIVLRSSRAQQKMISMTEGMTGTEMGDAVIAAAGMFGLGGEYARSKFEDEAPRAYDQGQATQYFNVLTEIDRILSTHRAQLSGRTGPVQLWAHGFDIAFEWFGSRIETHEEHGAVLESPAQINFGFYPGMAGVEPYFYSNPWPFAGEVLLGKSLPEGARWHTEGFEGSVFPYAALVGDEEASARLLAYAARVQALAAPTLMA